MTRPTRLSTILAAATLYVCSFAQLSIATIIAGHARHAMNRAPGVEPPLPVSMLLPLWFRIARSPWELVVLGLYIVLAVHAVRRDTWLGLAALWFILTTVFFVVVFVSLLLFKVCCV